jgi:hypothetical protein
LYKSKAQTFLGDIAMVDHNTKTCFFFQVADKDLQNHPVKLSVLENVMNRLKIREKNYTLHLIFVTDFSTEYPFGSKFEMEQTLEEKQNHARVRAVTLSQWKDQSNDQEGHLSHFVKSSIVRTKLSVSEELPLPVVKSAAGQKKFLDIDIVKKKNLQAALKDLQLPHIGPPQRSALTPYSICSHLTSSP